MSRFSDGSGGEYIDPTGYSLFEQFNLAQSTRLYNHSSGAGGVWKCLQGKPVYFFEADGYGCSVLARSVDNGSQVAYQSPQALIMSGYETPAAAHQVAAYVRVASIVDDVMYATSGSYQITVFAGKNPSLTAQYENVVVDDTGVGAAVTGYSDSAGVSVSLKFTINPDSTVTLTSESVQSAVSSTYSCDHAGSSFARLSGNDAVAVLGTYSKVQLQTLLFKISLKIDSSGDNVRLYFNDFYIEERSYGAGSIHRSQSSSGLIGLQVDTTGAFYSDTYSNQFNTDWVKIESLLVSLSNYGNELDSAPVFSSDTTNYLVRRNGNEQVLLDGSLMVTDADIVDNPNLLFELDTQGNYVGASITLSRHGGANSDDVFFAGPSYGSPGRITVHLPAPQSDTWYAGYLTSGNTPVNYSGEIHYFGSGSDLLIGYINYTAGTAVITFAPAIAPYDFEAVNEILRSISYRNINSVISDNSVAIDVTFSDGNHNAEQGVGGAQQTTVTYYVVLNSGITFNYVCSGTTKQAMVADGSGGFTTTVAETNSLYCGYNPNPDPMASNVRYYISADTGLQDLSGHNVQATMEAGSSTNIVTVNNADSLHGGKYLTSSSGLLLVTTPVNANSGLNGVTIEYRMKVLTYANSPGLFCIGSEGGGRELFGFNSDATPYLNLYGSSSSSFNNWWLMQAPTNEAFTLTLHWVPNTSGATLKLFYNGSLVAINPMNTVGNDGAFRFFVTPDVLIESIRITEGDRYSANYDINYYNDTRLLIRADKGWVDQSQEQKLLSFIDPNNNKGIADSSLSPVAKAFSATTDTVVMTVSDYLNMNADGTYGAFTVRVGFIFNAPRSYGGFTPLFWLGDPSNQFICVQVFPDALDIWSSSRGDMVPASGLVEGQYNEIEVTFRLDPHDPANNGNYVDMSINGTLAKVNQLYDTMPGTMLNGNILFMHSSDMQIVYAQIHRGTKHFRTNFAMAVPPVTALETFVS